VGNKVYPQFHSFYCHEELLEHFLLTPAELHFGLTFRGEQLGNPTRGEEASSGLGEMRAYNAALSAFICKFERCPKT
jgi:hypothetical protein